MAENETITILHLSDLQFGRNHRFGRLHLPPPDDTFDSLFARLRKDLDLLKMSHNLQPDLMIVTGDLAEQGLPKEFADARELLEKLADHLHLRHDRVALIPGNHDINRKTCEAYFSQCEGDEQRPVPPFTPKWKHYLAMFQEFYKDHPEIRFTIEEPWTLFEVADLKVVIAGLNSTMAECHDIRFPRTHPWHKEYVKSGKFGHFGICGETQLDWFSRQLEDFKAKGWLRIGAIHHNFRRGAAGDDANLRDADGLQKSLGGSLNLLLHGHTHEGRFDLMPNGVPILCTGSAGVTVEWRPEEVQNQYQFLRVRSDHLERYTRCFIPRQTEWVGDNSSSEDGSDWRTGVEVKFKSVHGVFGQSPDQYVPHPDPAGEREVEYVPDNPAATDRIDLLRRVMEIVSLRHPGARAEPMCSADSRLRYLRVAVPETPMPHVFPVGVFERGISWGEFGRFLSEVDAPYRASDPKLTSEIVFDGAKTAPPDLLAEADRRHVRLSRFADYQDIIDFGPYLKQQTARLEADPVYPWKAYVAQRMKFSEGSGDRRTSNALAKVTKWLDTTDGRFVLLLGSFGTGKTFLLHELARRLATDGRLALKPILIEMRALEKARDLDELVAQHLVRAGEKRFDVAAFRYMLAQGRIALLFDGFDELALRLSYDRAAEHLDTILQAASGRAKIVVTSRTQHFISHDQVKTVLWRKADAIPHHRFGELRSFTQPQIRQYLINVLGSEQAADERLALLHRIRDLCGLSENPRMLSFIVDLKEADLRKALNREDEITSAVLYRLLLERWLIFEYERAHPAGTSIILTREVRWQVVTNLALTLWGNVDRTFNLRELTDLVAEAVVKGSDRPVQPDVAAHLIGSGSLLVREEEGQFSFVHQSVMEWLIADRCADLIRKGQRADPLAIREMSDLMTDFFCSLLGTQAATEWVRMVLTDEGASDSAMKRNALRVLSALQMRSPVKGPSSRPNVVYLAHQNLRGQDLSGRDLHGANLFKADLTEALLVGSDLSAADLREATLVKANLTKAILRGARLGKADCSQASLMDAILEDCDLSETSLRRAKLVGAQTGQVRWDAERTWGAALPGGGGDVTPSWSNASACNCVAWSPDGELVAGGHDDNTVRLWEVSSGKELRQFTGHRDSVRSVSFSPDGRWLASGSDDNTVRLWEVSSGKELRQFTGHQNPVRSVSFSPDGRWLASGSDDNTVRLWEVSSGKELRQFTGHQNPVWSVSFSPDGRWLASGSSDKTVRLWEVSSGKELRQFTGHQNPVRSVSFSPDGRWLASGSYDNTVRLWEVSSGKELRQFTGHQNLVMSVSFSPDGRWLASGSYDNTVRLWEVSSGKELRQFTGHQNPVWSVSFSPDGRWLASGSDDKTVRLWEVSSGKELRQFTGHQNLVMSVSFSPDGRWLASGSYDNTVRLWEVSSGKELRQFTGHQNLVMSVSFSPDGRWLASGSYDNTVRLWEVSSGKELRQFTGHQSLVMSVSFSPDGRWLASGSYDKTVRLWEVSSGKELRQFTGHQNPVMSVSFSPDGRWLASGSSDNTVRLWEVSSGKELRQFTGHQNPVWSVSFSPDGRWLASGSYDNTVRLWEVSSGKELRQFTGHQNPVWSVSFSPDGRWLASGSDDKTVRLWEVSSGKELRQFTGHQSLVMSVSFSPDGRWLASGSYDNTVRLWRVETGECLALLFAMPEGWVAFTPEGRYKLEGNLAGGFWHMINLCRFEPGELDDYIPGLHMNRDEPFPGPTPSS